MATTVIGQGSTSHWSVTTLLPRGASKTDARRRSGEQAATSTAHHHHVRRIEHSADERDRHGHQAEAAQLLGLCRQNLQNLSSRGEV
jgi:hypothetical protein